MKKIAVLILAALFVASTLPAFAVEQPKKERNLYKIIKGTIKNGEAKPKNKLRNPLPKVTVFQHMANGIKEGSVKAKKETLRTATVK